MEAHASGECAGCEWERQPQAFRWFPELGTPLRLSPDPAAAEPTTAGSGGHAGLISPAVWVRAVSKRAAESAQLTTFHQALT